MTPRPWRPELVLFLAACMMISLSLAGMGMLLLQQLLPETTEARRHQLQFLMNTAGFHGAAFVLVHWFLRQHGVGWGEFFGWRLVGPRRAWLWGPAAGLLVIPVALGLNLLSSLLLQQLGSDPIEQEAVKILRNTSTGPELVLFGVSAVILAPLVEEMLFRGILYPLLRELGYPRLAAWGTALLFAAIHLNAMTFLPLTVMGLMFVWLYERTGCLAAPVIAHAVFNLVNFIMLSFGLNPVEHLQAFRLALP